MAEWRGGGDRASARMCVVPERARTHLPSKERLHPAAGGKVGGGLVRLPAEAREYCCWAYPVSGHHDNVVKRDPSAVFVEAAMRLDLSTLMSKSLHHDQEREMQVLPALLPSSTKSLPFDHQSEEHAGKKQEMEWRVLG